METFFVLSVVLRLQRVKRDLKGVFHCVLTQWNDHEPNGPNFVYLCIHSVYILGT